MNQQNTTQADDVLPELPAIDDNAAAAGALGLCRAAIKYIMLCLRDDRTPKPAAQR